MTSPAEIVPPITPVAEAFAVGVDIGGTNIKTVAVSLSGGRLYQHTQATDNAAGADTADDWVRRVRRQVETITETLGRTPEAIGLSAPGLAAPDGRSIAWMQGRMAAIQDLDWTTRLCLDRAVPVLNDAHAALLGELWLGAAAGCRNAFLLTLGTGVGGAIVTDGRLLRGHLGRAGHLGHISLDPNGAPDIVNTPGALEDAIGECTLPARSGGRFTRTRDLLAAAQNGDQDAQNIWDTSVRALAAGVAGLINVLDPEIIVLGGGIARAGEKLTAPLRAHLDTMEWRPTGQAVRLVQAQLGEYAGAYGAAYHAAFTNAG